MKKDDQQDSSEEEGFYKPQINILPALPDQSQPALTRPDSNANDLIAHHRPTDLLPRTLTSAPSLQPLPPAIRPSEQYAEQELLPCSRQKLKKCKYLSLKDKYQNNALFKLIYNKLEPPPQFNSYLFSLNHTTDYHPADYQPPRPLENDSPFDSRFESGNLQLAYLALEHKDQNYDLILQNDTNTRGYNHWFYFSFRNRNATSARFNIVNLIKKHSLFEQGVRPVAFSLKNAQKGWHSVGTDIDYQKSYITREMLTNPPSSKNYYTLSFTLQFQLPDDTLFIALNYPYTYTDMVNLLQNMESSRPQDIIIQQQILCHTISNNGLPAIKIRHKQNKDSKKILLMARQHPGETVGSFVLEAFLKQLLTQEKLLKNYEIIAIPMANPDGVIYGNFRTNLAGFDLNRQWTEPDRWMHPQIYAISRYIDSLQDISFVLDFHGHSKKLNSFIFACNGDPSYPFRVYPYIFSQTNDKFSIKDCTYNITVDKQRTARINLFRKINKPQIFTLETSFFGYEKTNGKKYRLKIQDLMEIGMAAVESLKTYLLRKKEAIQYQKQVREKEYLFDQWAQQNTNDLESQSNPSEDQLPAVQRKQKVISAKEGKKSKSKPKSKKKKSDKKSIMDIFEQKEKMITQQKLSIRVKSIKPKSPLPQAYHESAQIIRQKNDSQRLFPFKDLKIKSKKVQRAISIVSPLPIKQASISRVAPSPIQHKQPLSEQKVQKIQVVTQRKAELQPQKPSFSSNLFSKPNYFGQLQQRLQKRQNPQNQHNKTQSLEINSIKKQRDYAHGTTIDLIRRLVSTEQQDRCPPKADQLRKHREKLHAFRENRIVNSMVRINEQEMKKNFEEEINSRTQALKNCQRKMREITLDEPMLHTPTNGESFLRTHLPLQSKTAVFPALKLERKSEYLNF